MARENCFSKMEGTIKGNGRTTKCLDSANFTMKMVKLHMKDFGLMISSQEKGGFSMIGLKSLKAHSEDWISLSSWKNGSTTKESS